MSIADIKKTAESKMDMSIASFSNNLTKIRTGRASPALLDNVQVDYYGAMVPLSQVANVSLLDARTVSVQPWEKSMAAKIEKAIRDSRDANEAVKKLVKDKLASEDEQKRAEADIQKVTDKHIADIDKVVASKEQEIMAV